MSNFFFPTQFYIEQWPPVEFDNHASFNQLTDVPSVLNFVVAIHLCTVKIYGTYLFDAHLLTGRIQHVGIAPKLVYSEDLKNLRKLYKH